LVGKEWETAGMTGSTAPEEHRIKSTGGVTVAVIKNEDDTLSWGFSKCSDLDTYNKKVGRTIAVGRAVKKGITTKNMEYKTVRNISLQLAEEIYSLEASDQVKLTEIDPNSIEDLLSETKLEESK